ncbi:response regulator [Bacillus clarus]|uniref:Response regulator n=1 Tax=Bacillus clarus TaxID=2338372 RepID=A0A090YT16_9BACI|nr:response regulator [Bacillus clarus]
MEYISKGGLDIGQQSILIVDDDRDIVQLIKHNLEQEGFKVFRAYHGDTALDIVNKNEVQLAILDIMMP